jgi:hypothetical protein
MTARNVQPIPFQYKCAVQLCEAEGRHEVAQLLHNSTHSFTMLLLLCMFLLQCAAVCVFVWYWCSQWLTLIAAIACAVDAVQHTCMLHVSRKWTYAAIATAVHSEFAQPVPLHIAIADTTGSTVGIWARCWAWRCTRCWHLQCCYPRMQKGTQQHTTSHILVVLSSTA